MSKKYGELKNYEIIIQGVLKKSPPQKHKAFFNFITKRWKKRHFVLYKTARPNHVSLVYFKIDPTPESKNIGEIDLVKLTNLSANVGASVNRSNVFSIQTADDKGDQRVYFMRAKSLELMNLWVERMISCLNLNANGSRANSGTCLSSPTSHNRSKSMPHVLLEDVTTPKHISAMVSVNSLSETQRFSFTNSSDRSHKNTTSSYYNLSPGIVSLSQEPLEDPLLAEEDDVYKLPREPPNEHSYANIEDDDTTPVATKNDLSEDLFFTNDYNDPRYSHDGKSLNLHSGDEFKSLTDDSVFEYQNLPCNELKNQFANKSSENKSLDECYGDFDFPLPTRVRSESTSSSSSSNSSLSATDITSTKSTIGKENQLHLSDNICPPRIPKRLNLYDTNKKNISTNTVLPVKTPKSILTKSDSSEFYSAYTDDSPLMSLNYVDAENLMLGNRHENVVSESVYQTLDGTPSHLMNYMSPLDFVTSDTSSPFDDFGMSPVLKEAPATVEYREISDTRTEALLKLNVRIQNNDK